MEYSTTVHDQKIYPFDHDGYTTGVFSCLHALSREHIVLMISPRLHTRSMAPYKASVIPRSVDGYNVDGMFNRRWVPVQYFLLSTSRLHITDLVYSDFTQKRATSFGLKGWVKNTSDGLVCLILGFPFKPYLTKNNRSKARPKAPQSQSTSSSKRSATALVSRM